MRALAALLAAIAVLALPAAAMAASCPRTSAQDVSDEVMCLECGVPLNVAEDAPSAKRERAYIQSMVDRCASKGQIKSALVDQFGDRVLALPRASGFSLTAYLVPAFAVAFGLAVVAMAALRWRSARPAGGAGGGGGAAPAAAADPPPNGAESESSARLDADLERYEL